ncbi:MAG: aspartyl protease family protein [Saprospiraceae bacterium]|nr:aspartyl protease family protein [Saprospiraceae bacterium]
MKNQILFLFIFFLPLGLSSQVIKKPKVDFKLSQNSKKIELPFEYENNFIIVKVLFNNFLPLRFIFDTGAEHTILTKREISDLMAINYTRKFSIMGADLTTVLIAYLTQNIDLTIGRFKALNKNILVLDDDYFKFDQFAGIDVQGIIGADLFRRYIVKINFKRKVITLYQPKHFEAPSKKYIELPVEIKRHKPYVTTNVQFADQTELEVKLLLDTGASLPLMLHTNTHPNLDLPEKIIRSKLAAGLGGDLEGFIGRTQKLFLKDVVLQETTTYFQDLPDAIDSIQINSRNGIIGNEILSRFVVIFDYINEKVYLKPAKKFKKKFKFDRSGLLLARSGKRMEHFVVYSVIKDSPAEKAGIQVGDVIIRCNGWPSSFYTLEGISRKFKKRVGKKIKLKVQRDNQKLEFKFKLRNII